MTAVGFIYSGWTEVSNARDTLSGWAWLKIQQANFPKGEGLFKSFQQISLIEILFNSFAWNLTLSLRKKYKRKRKNIFTFLQAFNLEIILFPSIFIKLHLNGFEIPEYKLKEGKHSLDTMKKFFTVRVVTYWNKLPTQSRMCLYFGCCRRMLFCSPHITTAVSQLSLFPALQHGVSQHPFQLLPQSEGASVPSPLPSSGQSGRDVYHILEHRLKWGALWGCQGDLILGIAEVWDVFLCSYTALPCWTQPIIPIPSPCPLPPPWPPPNSADPSLPLLGFM